MTLPRLWWGFDSPCLLHMLSRLVKSLFLCYHVCSEGKLHTIKKDMFDLPESDVSLMVLHLKSLAEIRCFYYLYSKVITINWDNSRLVIINHHLSNTMYWKEKHLIFQTYPHSIYNMLTLLSIEHWHFLIINWYSTNYILVFFVI